MKRTKIWVDCDPGIDDAVALAMVAASKDRLQLCGISTVAGNQTSDRVTKNALLLASFLGLEDVPVVRGTKEPLLQEMQPADHVHGSTGLGDCVLPDTTKTLAAENGILYLRDTLMSLPAYEQMTLVATGPLTNIALLLKTFPEVMPKIQHIISMGGSTVEGNCTETAEFNICTDPEAAQIVYASGLEIVMCGLDITNYCGLTRQQIASLSKGTNKIELAYGKMLEFYANSPAYDDFEFICIHDVSTILYLLEPEMYEGKNVSIRVDCSSEQSRGTTFISNEEKKNVLMLTKVDQKKYQEIILNKLADAIFG